MFLAIGLVGAVLAGLLVGYEPVGGDPDRLYRPLKAELARSLARGELPVWSDRFGVGLPLVAESHVAAFYPPNWLLYRALDVTTAYRLSMWLHHLALAASTYFYARTLAVQPPGAAVAAVAFTFCGFQAIHSSHEPFYCLMPYLPMALGIAERFLQSGRSVWLAGLAIVLGLQWTLGHFQVQAWTGGLVVLTALWRASVDGLGWRRAGLTILAVPWGAAIAAVQLGPSWQFAGLVGQGHRPIAELLAYAFPTPHWFESALPRLVRDLRLGPEDPYWSGEQTTGYEAALYVGTIPTILAIVGTIARPTERGPLPWRWLVPIAFAAATMPRWWPQGYLVVMAILGVGVFRVPARYTLLSMLGVSILAGEGLDRSIGRGRFRAGMAAALAFAAVAAGSAAAWASRPDVHLRASIAGIPDGFLWGALAWSVGTMVVILWRSGRLPSGAVAAAVAVELGALYYAGTTQWGWSITIPGQSPVLEALGRDRDVVRVGGEIADLPVRAGLSTGDPYIGFNEPWSNRLLVMLQERLFWPETGARVDVDGIRRWFRRCRVTHLVDGRRSASAIGPELGRWRDPALDRIVHRRPGEPASRSWSIVRVEEPFPEARVAARMRVAPDRPALVARLLRSDDLDTAWFLAEDGVDARPDARSARLVSWDGASATVDHEGPCDLVLARTFDPGWLARVGDGPERPVLPVDGGFQAVRLDGSGVDRVTLRYRTRRMETWVAISLAASIAALAVAAASIAKTRNNRAASDE